MSDRPVHAFGYVRGSTDEQETTLGAQEKTIRLYAERNGITLVDVLVDKGTSASLPFAEREGGKLLATHAARRTVQAVIATRIDRLFRDTLDCLTTIDGWTKRKVALHIVDSGGVLSSTTTMGRFQLIVQAAVAELERGMIIDRTVSALDHMRSKSQRTTSIAPYGYRHIDSGDKNVPDTVAPDDDEQRVIEQMRAMRARGATIRDIAHVLNETSVPARGSRWHHTTVARILAREAERTKETA